ncbi:hypothetical protein [Sphingomonas oryzagri]
MKADFTPDSVSKPRFYVLTIEADGMTKRLIKIEQGRQGDVYALTNYGNFLNNTATPFEPSRARITQQKYTIHRSLKSPERINTIKHEFLIEGHDLRPPIQATKAIKQTNSIALLFSAMHPSLIKEKYNYAGEGGNSISLGKMDNSNFKLFYAVAVSGADRPLADLPRWINRKTVRLNHFSLHFFWAFGLGPASDYGEKWHFMTLPPEIIPSDLQELMDVQEGLDENRLASLLRESWTAMLEKFARTASELIPDTRDIHNLITAFGLIRTGTRGTPEYISRLRKAIEQIR